MYRYVVFSPFWWRFRLEHRGFFTWGFFWVLLWLRVLRLFFFPWNPPAVLHFYTQTGPNPIWAEHGCPKRLSPGAHNVLQFWFRQTNVRPPVISTRTMLTVSISNRSSFSPCCCLSCIFAGWFARCPFFLSNFFRSPGLICLGWGCAFLSGIPLLVPSKTFPPDKTTCGVRIPTLWGVWVSPALFDGSVHSFVRNFWGDLCVPLGLGGCGFSKQFFFFVFSSGIFQFFPYHGHFIFGGIVFPKGGFMTVNYLFQLLLCGVVSPKICFGGFACFVGARVSFKCGLSWGFYEPLWCPRDSLFLRLFFLDSFKVELCILCLSRRCKFFSFCVGVGSLFRAGLYKYQPLLVFFLPWGATRLVPP